MAIITYSSMKVLDNSIKNKDLKTDENGYRRILIGAYNVYNSAGDFYPFTDEVKKLFENSSELMRRVRNGALIGEMGHPALEKGMSLEEYIVRLHKIEETRYSTHFRELELEEESDGTVSVYAWLKPYGAFASTVEEGLKNPHINLAYSVRSLSKGVTINSVLYRNVKKILTWDAVTEPGIERATKFGTLKRQSDISVENRDILQFDSMSLEDMKTVKSMYEENKELFGLESKETNIFKEMLGLFDCKDGTCKLMDW